MSQRWFLATGQRPFYAEYKDPNLVLQAFANGQEPRPKAKLVGHPGLRKLIVQAWAADPQQR